MTSTASSTHKDLIPGDAQRNAAPDDDPPCSLLAKGFGYLAVLQLVDKSNDHTDKDLHTAQRQRAQHDEDDIIDRGKQRLPEPRKGAFRVDDLQHLRDEIPEEAAGKGAHEEGGNTAQPQQRKEIMSAAGGLLLFSTMSDANIIRRP